MANETPSTSNDNISEEPIAVDRIMFLAMISKQRSILRKQVNPDDPEGLLNLDEPILKVTFNGATYCSL
jgi:hypothetical protein